MSETPCAGWEGRTARELAERWGAARVELFTSLGSTSDVARRLAGEGAPEGTLVLAEEQLAGRGRAGRSWASPQGLGLWISFVGRGAEEGDAGPLPLRVGLALAAALDPFVAEPGVGIKWPNDLWLAGRKLGGILCEGSWMGGRPGPVVVGVGLNVLHPESSFPPELRAHATSLAAAAAAPVSRLEVADRVVPAVLHAIRDDAPLDVAALAARDQLRGNAVEVSDPMTGRTLARGTAAGILPDGALRLVDAAGDEQHIRSGTVRLVD